MLGALDQPNVGVSLDRLDPALGERAVVRRPVVGRVGDRSRVVALEPGRLGLAAVDLAGEHDLERALAERERRRLGLGRREVVGDEPEGGHLASWPWNLSTVPTRTSVRPAASRCSRRQRTWALQGDTTITSSCSSATSLESDRV